MSQKNPQISRRRFLAGAATAGAAAAGAAAGAVALPVTRDTVPTPEQAKPVPKNGGGYYLSEHVKRYYKTTLL